MSAGPEPLFLTNLAPDVAVAAERLRHGGVVAFPTETVYGLGASALDEAALARVFEIKGRPRFDPLIVHVAEVAQARSLVRDWPGVARRLAEAFWPGPLTLVLPKREVVPDLATAGLPNVAVRVPGHQVALALIAAAGVPVAAPSANRFGSISPTTAKHVRAELGGAVDLVLDGGPCETGVESTVVSLVEPESPRVLRLGGLAVERIEAVLGQALEVVAGVLDERSAVRQGLASPGMTQRHYAPNTPMSLVDDAAAATVAEDERAGLLTLRPVADTRFVMRESLSVLGDLREAAAGLFAAMRRLDGAGLDRIVAVRVPEEGLGRPINDRLRRASVTVSG